MKVDDGHPIDLVLVDVDAAADFDIHTSSAVRA